MPQRKLTIGVISSFLNGHYYGGLISGIHDECRKNNLNFITIQTFQDYADNFEIYEEQSPFAMDYIDAWIVILHSANEEYLNLLRKTGKPIIGIANQIEGFPSVLIDNYYGMYQAVEHLIQHGHKKIAFLGFLKHRDLLQRFEGYKAALEDHHIPFDESLVYQAEGNYKENADDPVKEMIDDKVPFTAIAAGTDNTAATAIQILQDHGYRVPEDIAITGFDNSYTAKEMKPSITSVNQSTYSLGRESITFLLRIIEEKLDITTLEDQYVSTELIIRESCNCKVKDQEQLSYHELAKENEINSNLVSYLSSVINSTHAVGKHLINANKDEITSLSWLEFTTKKFGCIGLWNNAQTKEALVIDKIYRDGEYIIPDQRSYTVESFPPKHFIEDSEDENYSYITIHPIKSSTQDWGVLALKGPLEDIMMQSDEEAMFHWINLLASAFDRETLHDKISDREEHYRLLAEELEIVSNTTNDGIWKWNLITNDIEWNARIHHMLGVPKDNVKTDIYSFFQLIYPDDIKRVKALFLQHLHQKKHFHTEMRLLRDDGEYFWVYIAGEIIRDNDGEPLRMIGSIQDITERKEAEEKIRQIAYYDSLTKLPNRIFFHQKLQESLETANKNEQKLAIFLIDLDRFKNINDSYGHQKGDQFLRFVAQQLQTHLSNQCFIARLGGDEFVLLAPRIEEEEEVLDLAQHILEVLKTPYVDEGIEFHITGSLGISIYPNDGEDPDTLIKNADIAMYRAKWGGKNMLKLYNPNMDEHKVQLNMENQLRKSINSEDFLLVYQPQIDSKSGEVMGYEALLRWNLPDGRIMPPNEFIPIAEETGLIVPIGYWVIKEACKQIGRWLDQGYPAVKISVNISGRQFIQADFVQQVKNILTETETDPTLLIFEITESTAIQNIEFSISMLQELNELGIKISIDDFGTGYSSLSLLKRLPVAFVKIDKSFIRDMSVDEDDSAIIGAIISMSHYLQLKVIAEGVETEEQYKMLQELTCDYMQGYYISYPQKAEVIEQRFLQNEINK